MKEMRRKEPRNRTALKMSLIQDPNDNSMLDMLIGYSCIQIRILLLLFDSIRNFILHTRGALAPRAS